MVFRMICGSVRQEGLGGESGVGLVPGFLFLHTKISVSEVKIAYALAPT